MAIQPTQGVPVPAQYIAHQNPGESMDDYDDRRQKLMAQYYTERLKADPNFQLPGNYHQTAQGVVPTEPSFLMRHPWLIPLIGAGAGIAGGAIAGAAAGSAPAAAAPAAAATGAEAAGDIGAIGATAAGPAVGAETGGAFAAGTGPGLVPGAGFTGAGVTDRILSTAGQVAPIINGINANMQQGRESEALTTQRQDQLENTRYQNQIAAAKLNLDAPNTRASTSVHGDILANAQPLRLTGQTQMVGNTPVPQTSGGLSPDVFSDNTRQLGKTISEQMLKNQQTNEGRAIEPQDPFAPLPDANGTGSRILQGAGTVASLLGAINYGRRRS